MLLLSLMEAVVFLKGVVESEEENDAVDVNAVKNDVRELVGGADDGIGGSDAVR